MEQLLQDEKRFSECGIDIIIVCPEKEESLKRYLDKHPMPFLFVSDKTHEIADSYNQEVNLFKLGRMPAEILFDKDGNRLYEHHGSSMSDITGNDVIFEKVDC